MSRRYYGGYSRRYSRRYKPCSLYSHRYASDGMLMLLMLLAYYVIFGGLVLFLRIMIWVGKMVLYLMFFPITCLFGGK